jgi:single-stranded-DNA-specific exonuclease
LALGSAVVAARQAGLLVNGGGHPMAAGFTVEAAKLGPLRDFLAERAAAALGDAILAPELAVDGVLAAGAATLELMALLERLAPFGTGNPEPRFAFPNLRVLRAEIVGGQHLRCILGDGAGTARLKAIAFRCLEGPLGPALLHGQGRNFHVAGHLRGDHWQDRDQVQLVVEDAAPVG